jgi:ribosomal protein S27AE
MKYVDKTTGVVYTKRKCPNCGKKSFVSPGNNLCSSCSKEIYIPTIEEERKAGASGTADAADCCCSLLSVLFVLFAAVPLIELSFGFIA